MKKLTHELVSHSICKLRERWVKTGEVNEISDINRGWCYSFAEELLTLLCEEGVSNSLILWDRGELGDKGVYFLSNENFMKFQDENGNEIPPWFIDKYGMEYYHWDIPLLEKWNIRPPKGMTWKELNQIPFGYHVFIFFDGQFYDAECPEGVFSFFDLPLYKETIKKHIDF